MIQAVSDLVNLEQVIKGADKVGRKNRGGDLESVIKEYMGRKEGGLEKFGQEDLFETFEQEDLEIVGQEDSAPPDPPVPPRRSQQTVEKEDLETVGQEDSAPPNLPAPPIIIQQKSGHPSCYVGTSYQ